MFSFSIAALTILVMVLLGTFVYLTNPSARINRYFAFFVGFLVLWIISNFLENEPAIVGLEHLNVFLRLDFAFAVLLFYAWFRFGYFFSRIQIPILTKSYTYLILLICGFILVGLSLFTDLIITDISFETGVIAFKDGTLWFLYAIYLLALAIGGLTFLYLGKRKARTEKNTLIQSQINLVFIGFFIAIGNALFINLGLQTFFPISVDVSRLGIYGMIALVGFTSYAIIKHHFFDIRLVMIRTVTFLFLLFILVAAYGYLLILFVSNAFDEALAPGIVIVSIMLTALAAVSFAPLHHYLRQQTSKIFYRGYYDPDKLLAELTHIMATDIDIDSMTSKMLHQITGNLNISNAILAIVNNDKTFALKKAHDTSNSLSDIDATAIASMCAQYTATDDIPHTLLLRDLEEGIVKDFLRQHKIGMVIPIRVRGQHVACLILGEKLSGEAYTDTDTTFLNIFANEAGIAVQNAQSYLEIKRFSEELEYLVEERTAQLEMVQKRELKKAQDVAALKDEFVFLATHELRAPVTAIKLFLELTTQKKQSLPKQFKENIESITRASDHLNQLIDDLLEVARNESPEATLAVDTVDIREVTLEVADELRALSDKQDVQIEIADTYAKVPVQANKEKLREVLTNLISNAIKYNKKGGEILITFINFADSYITEVRDTGIGISNKQKGKIFQKFFRADSPKTNKVIGTGLGMFITRMLVEKMGGSIDFTSLHNEGTTVAFSLPKVTGKKL